MTLTEKIEELLKDESISAYHIEKQTGVSQPIISRLRNGKRDLGNIRLSVAEKLGSFWDKIQKNS